MVSANDDVTFDQVIEYLKQRRVMHFHDAEKRNPFDTPEKARDKARSLAVQQCIDGLKAMRKRMLKNK